jgi:hypothetical protein
VKGIVILIGVAVLAFVVFLWTPDQADLIKHTVTVPLPTIPEFNYPLPQTAPKPMDRPEQLDCLAPDFIRDKNVDRDWDQCPRLL